MSPLLVIFVTVFINLLGFGIIIPLLPFYAEHFGASALIVGLLSTSFSLMQFLFAPFWGRLSDRIGRRPVILIGLIGSALWYSLFALATSLTMLFVARCLAGIAGANIPTAQAFIADITTKENRARGMGMIGAAFGLGFVFGPAIGGFLSHWGYAAPAWFAAAISFANFVAALFLLPESRSASDDREQAGRLEAFRRALVRPHLPLVLLVYFLVLVAFSSFEATFALFSERQFGFTSTTIGYMFAWIGVVLATVQGALVGRVAKRVGEQRIVPVAIVDHRDRTGADRGIRFGAGACRGERSAGAWDGVQQSVDAVGHFPAGRSARPGQVRLVCRSPWEAWRASSARPGEAGCSINSVSVCRSSRHPP